MKRLLIPVFAVILCAVFSLGVLADTNARLYSEGGGDPAVATVFVIVCALILAVLITGYQIRKRKHRARMKKAEKTLLEQTEKDR